MIVTSKGERTPHRDVYGKKFFAWAQIEKIRITGRWSPSAAFRLRAETISSDLSSHQIPIRHVFRDVRELEAFVRMVETRIEESRNSQSISSVDDENTSQE